MAHFLAKIEPGEGKHITRTGGERGMGVTLNGYDFGLFADIWYNPETGEDELHVRLTGGSRNGRTIHDLGTFTESQIRLIQKVTR